MISIYFIVMVRYLYLLSVYCTLFKRNILLLKRQYSRYILFGYNIGELNSRVMANEILLNIFICPFME